MSRHSPAQSMSGLQMSVSDRRNVRSTPGKGETSSVAEYLLNRAGVSSGFHRLKANNKLGR